MWFGFSTALPDPALWQLLRASLGLFLQRSKRLQVLPVAGTVSLAPPANGWWLVWFLAPGQGFPCGIPRAACSVQCPPQSLHRASPQHAPASLQPITPGLPCSQGTSWVLRSSCSPPAPPVATAQNLLSHSRIHTHTHADVYAHIHKYF